MSILTAERIEKSYRKNRVLRGASLTIEPGEVVGLTGENGCGKSTFLKIAIGLLAPDAGTMRVAGSSGYCPQESVLFDALTMEENVSYFAAGYGLASTDAQERSRALMERLNCREHASKRAGELSGGTKQKLNLIIALLHRPELLIMDEPYQGFDYESYLAFWDLAAEFKRDGRSAVVVSHMLVDRERLDRVYSIVEGQIRSDDETHPRG